MVNVPLIAAADLAGFRGAPFSAQVTEAAAESVRSECDWHLAPSVTETVKLRGGGGVLILPSLRVTAIASITGVDGTVVDGWEWMPNGVVERMAGAFPRFVNVTFTHGYDACPKELLPIIAERAQSQASGRIKSEALAGRSVSLEGGYDPATEGALAKYRLNSRP